MKHHCRHRLYVGVLLLALLPFMPASTDAASHAPSDSASSRAPLVAAHIPPATRTFTGTATLRAFHTDLIERKTSDIHRKGHTATLLRDGKVLIVGGYDEWSGSSGDDWTTHANAELYNPVTGVFSTTTSLAESRTFHTATLLPDGTVLVAGGYSAQPFNVRATAELYQPTKGTWVRSTNMAKPRAEHTATLLTNGKVLVVGGRSQGTVLSDAELYDSRDRQMDFYRSNERRTERPHRNIIARWHRFGYGWRWP
jgi:hypothetical protein